MSDPVNLSHNLRTPLTVITLVLDLCLRRGEDLPPEALKGFLTDALEQAKKLETAICEAEQATFSTILHEENNVIVLHEETNDPIRVIGSGSSRL